MSGVMPRVYDLDIMPLSPIHVGSGATIEPLEYRLVDRGGGDYWLEVFDLTALLGSLNDQQRDHYLRMLNRADYPTVRTWVRHQARSEHVRFSVQIQESAWALLDRHADNPESRCEIHLMTRDAATGRAYLPGSSVKGAIRTALVDAAIPDASPQQLQRACGDRASRRSSAVFEAAVLGHDVMGRQGFLRADLYRDPLRQVAIADAPLPDDACYIDRIEIITHGDPTGNATIAMRSDGILIFRDLTWSMLDGETIIARSELRLLNHLADARIMGRNRKGEDHALPRTIGVDDICRTCNKFYLPRLQDELDAFAVDAVVAGDLLKSVKDLGAHECLVRFGRHSHFECVTVRPEYTEKPRRGVGGSRSYAGGILPLGWAKLRFRERF